MRTITLEELLEAGSHFGHQVTRQNPKSRDYVFEARDGIHIIDLAKTKENLEEAARFVKSIAEKGGTMVVLGTKKQAEQVVKDEVKRASEAGADGLYYVTNRWIGGIFTNFGEVAKNFRKLKDLTAKLNDENAQEGYTKKEISLWDRERQKLESFYSGIKDMSRIPDALFVIDTHLEDLAVREAINLKVKTVGITDTNSDPTLINYPIPANDDAVGSVQLITRYIIDAWIEGRTKATKAAEDTKAAEEKAAAKSETEKEVVKTEEKTKKEEVAAPKKETAPEVVKKSKTTDTAEAKKTKKKITKSE